MIEVTNLTKCYGNFTAVDNLSFSIGEGHVYGFLGPNGAGKSTTMNIMAGCLSATEGSIKIGSFDIFEDPNNAKALIGYLPEQPPLYMNETPQEYLHFVGRAKGLRGEALKEQIRSVIKKTKLESVQNRKISALSKGYKQRVGIAQALLGNPKVIILDEPTVGLDPLQIIEIRDLIKELGKTHTVIFSSHILSEVQAICDQVLIIAHGKLLAFDTPENLERKLLRPHEIVVTAEANERTLRNILELIPGVQEVCLVKKDAGRLSMRLKTKEKDLYQVSGDIYKAFTERGLTLLEMSLKRANLEDIFLELTDTVPSIESEVDAQ